jgi:hypothetical protein
VKFDVGRLEGASLIQYRIVGQRKRKHFSTIVAMLWEIYPWVAYYSRAYSA